MKRWKDWRQRISGPTEGWERRGSAALSSGRARRRNATWAASDTSHDSIIPKNAALRMNSNASLGAHFSSTSATTIPYEEASNAGFGDPAAFRRPSSAGAHPVRASENSMREATYRAALAPESAAVSTTKFIRLLAPGMFTERNTVTKGLSVTPARFQGITPTSTTMAPRYTNVSVMKVIQTAFATSGAERDSPEVTATNSTPPNV